MDEGPLRHSSYRSLHCLLQDCVHSDGPPLLWRWLRMSSSRHTCNCDHCRDGRGAKHELQHGGMDWEADDEALVPYRKPSRPSYRKGRPCKKSKTGEVCDFSDVKVIGTRWRRDSEDRLVPYEDKIFVCSRCGRYSWKHYFERWGW